MRDFSHKESPAKTLQRGYQSPGCGGRCRDLVNVPLPQEFRKFLEKAEFGKVLELVTDHTAANQRATAVAGQMGVTPPSEPNKQQKAVYDRLSKLSGDAFDRQFVKHMVDDHKKDVAEYQKEAKRRNDPAAGYASETLATLQQHLQTAQSLAKDSAKRR